MGWVLAPAGAGSPSGAGWTGAAPWRPDRRLVAAVLAAVLAALSGASLLPIVERAVAPNATDALDDSAVDSLDDLGAADRASIEDQIAAAQLHFAPQPDGSSVAGNPTAGIDARVAPTGLVVNLSGAADATVALTATAFGRASSLAPLPAGVVTATDETATIDRGAVREWLVNRSEGLEQGFTLLTAPAGTGPVALALDVAGAAASIDSPTDARFTLPDGSTITYRGLTVVDADGDDLDASFATHGADLRISFDDVGATYPVVVDPVLSSNRLDPLPNTSLDQFGTAVDADGPWLAVGAPGDGVPVNEGAAYLFHRWDDGEWRLVRKLLPTQTGLLGLGAGGALGQSVAVVADGAGATVVAGAPAARLSASGPQTGGAFVWRVSGDPDSGTESVSASQHLVPTATGSAPGFGVSVAMDGDVLVVGAPNEDPPLGPVPGGPANEFVGAAYVFRRAAAGAPYALSQELRPPGNVANGSPDFFEAFGRSVAVDDGVIAVGLPMHDGFVHEAIARVDFEDHVLTDFSQTVRFAPDGSSLGAGPTGSTTGGGDPDTFLQATATSDGNSVFWPYGDAPLIGDQSRAYGGSLTFSQHTDATGALPATNDDLQLTGTVNGELWTIRVDLPAPTPGTWTRQQVRLSPLAAVGWRLHRIGGVLQPGSATVTEDEMRQLLSDLTAIHIRATYEAAGGGTEVVGLDSVALWPGPEADRATTQGRVLVFEEQAGTFELFNELVAPTTQDGGWFGSSLDVAGGTLAIGEPAIRLAQFGPDINVPGQVHLFQRDDGAGWLHQQTLTGGASGDPDDGFGAAIDLRSDGLRLAVGSPYEDQLAGEGSAGAPNVANRGSVSVFSRSDASDTFGGQVQHLGDDQFSGRLYGVDVDIDAGVLHVGASGDGSAALARDSSGSVRTTENLDTASMVTTRVGPVGEVTDNGFGFSTAQDFDLLAVAAPGERRTSAGQGAVYIFRRIGGAWQRESIVVPPPSGLGDVDDSWFGYHVSAGTSPGGDYVLVGAHRDDVDPDGAGGPAPAVVDAGSAYLYRRNNTTGAWDFVRRFVAPTPETGAAFGVTVAIGGSILISSIFEDTAAGVDAGAVHRFTGTGSSWTAAGVLTSAAPQPGARFGSLMARGATGQVAIAQYPAGGVAEVDLYNENGPITHLQHLATTVPADTFDTEIDIRGNRLAVSNGGDHGPRGPEVEVYSTADFRTGPWSLETIITAPADVATDESFGYQIALARGGPDRLMVGAVYHQPDGVNRGEAYLYSPGAEPGDPWVLEARYQTDAPAPGAEFGYDIRLWPGNGGALVTTLGDGTDWGMGSIQQFPVLYRESAVEMQPDFDTNIEYNRDLALLGDLLFVAMPIQAVGGFDRAGRVDVFRRVGTSWVFQESIEPPAPEQFGLFGYSIDAADGQLVVGSVQADPGGVFNGGAAYVFEPADADRDWQLAHTIVAPDVIASLGFGTSVSLDGDDLWVGASLADGDGSQGTDAEHGAAYAFRRVAGTWEHVTTALAAAPAVGEFYGYDVEVSDGVALVGAPNFGRVATEHVDVWAWNGSTWARTQRIDDPAPAEDTRYWGFGLDIAGGVAVIGHPTVPQEGEAGEVHTYAVDGTGTLTAETILHSPGVGGADYFGFYLDLSPSGDRLVTSYSPPPAVAVGPHTGVVFDTATWEPLAQFHGDTPIRNNENWVGGVEMGDGGRAALVLDWDGASTPDPEFTIFEPVALPPTVPPPATAFVDVALGQNQVAVGATAVPTAGIPPSLLAEHSRPGGGIAATGLGSIDLSAPPAPGLAASPLGDATLVDLFDRSAGIAAAPLTRVPLTRVPLTRVGLDWTQVLVGTPLEGAPLHTVSLDDVLSLDPRPSLLSTVTLADVDLSASALAAASLITVALADVPLTRVGLGDATTPPVTQWCDALIAVDFDPAVAGLDCDDPSAPANDEIDLMRLTLAGAPLTRVPLTRVPLTRVDLADAPLTRVPLTRVDVQGSPLTRVPLTRVDIDDTPLTRVPLTRVALEGAPLTRVPLTRVPLTRVELGGTALAEIPLTRVDLVDSPLTRVPLTRVDILDSPLTRVPLTRVPLTRVPLEGIPLTRVQIDGASLADVPLTRVDIGGSPLTRVPLARVDLAGSPLTRVPLTRVPLTRVPLEGIPLTRVAIADGTLADLPLAAVLAGGGAAAAALDGIRLAEIAPAARSAVVDCEAVDCGDPDLTLGSAARAGAVQAGGMLGHLTGGFGRTTFGQLAAAVAAYDGTDLRAAVDALALTLGELLDLGDLTLGDLPADHPDVQGTVLGDLLGALGSLTYGDLVGALLDITEDEVRAAVDALGATLGDLEDLGDLVLGDLPLDDPALAETVLGDLTAALGDLRLADLADVIDSGAGRYSLQDLVNAFTAAFAANATLGDLGGPEGDYGSLTLGELADFGDTTIGQLLGALDPELLEDLTLGDLLLALLGRAEYPWEQLDLAAVEAQAFDGTSNPVSVSVAFQAVGRSTPAPVRIDIQLPVGTSLVPGSLQLPASIPAAPEPQLVGGSLSVVLQDVPPALQTLSFAIEPSLTIGVGRVTATATILDDDVADTDVADLTVAEALEPNDTVATAVPLVEDTIHLSHVSSSDDIDVFSFPITQAGTQVSLILSNLDADLDVVLYGPTASSVDLQDLSPRSILPVEDESGSAVPVAEQIATEPLDDLARPTDLADLALVETSIGRGRQDERIDTGPLDRVGTYYAVVDGYNGAVNRQPYALRMKSQAPPARPACVARTVAAGPTLGTLPAPSSLPTDLDTLIVLNRSRLAGLHSPAEADAVVAAADALVAYVNDPAHDDLDVSAAVIGVDGDPAVRAAYDAWDAASCLPDGANAVAAEIIRVLDTYRSERPGIRHVVLVGGDDVVPFARVPDKTEIANESEYAPTFGDANNSLFGAASTAHVLTDDPYGDVDPYRFGDRALFVTDTAVGRLVEHPADIVDALADYVTAGGRLEPASGLVAGYDFLTDGSESVSDSLTPAVGADGLVELISETWTRGDLADALLPADGQGPSLASVNAHFDHHRALPADQNAARVEDDLFLAAAVRAAASDTLLGSLLFSMGCHGGLSTSDALFSAGDGRALDFAQAVAEQGGVFVGNTGYGYGDTELVALSERLMTLFAQRLDGSVSIGEALLFAKQEYAADLTAYGVYDEKTLMEATFYGLPFYRLDVADPPAPPALPPAPQVSPDPISGVDTSTLVITSSDELVTTPDGSYYAGADAATGEQQVTAVHDRPVQPREEVSFALPADRTVHDALVTGLTTTDSTGFDPFIHQAVVDEGAERIDRPRDVVFPAAPVRVNPELVPQGQSVNLSATTGYFRTTASDGTGLQRSLEEIEVQTFYARPTASDFTAPTFSSVSASVTDGLLSFVAEVSDDQGDADGVRRVYVLLAADPQPSVPLEWEGLDLVRTPGTDRWTGSLPVLGEDLEFIAQAVDAFGNVAITTNKALNFRDEVPLADPPSGALEVSLTGPEGQAGWYLGPVTVSATAPSTTTVEVDGGAAQPVPAQGVVVTGDGPHEVVIRTAAGEQVTRTFRIDTAGPVAVVTAPTHGTVVGQGSDLEPRFVCLDAGSGATSCTPTLDGLPVPADITATPGVHTLTVTAGPDVAGNPPGAPSTATYEVVGPPDVGTITLSGDGATLPGGTVSASAPFSGAPAGGPYTAIWNWGDGTTTTCTSGGPAATGCSVTAPSAPGTAGSTSASHTFAGGALARTVTLTVANRFSGADAATATVWICTIVGTAAANTLTGTSGRDVICALAGNDTINAGSGDDLVFGGDGVDTITGGDGDDVVFGQAHNDRLSGSGGNDVLLGGEGDDNPIDGGAGRDVLEGGAGKDTIRGGTEPDVIGGGDGDDIIEGGTGNDVIEGWLGNDVLKGNDGNDLITDVFSGNDTLDGGGHDDALFAGPGADGLLGGAGSDHLDGGPGLDSLNGGTNTDRCVGTVGDTKTACELS